MFRITHSEGSFLKDVFLAALAPLDTAPIRVSNDELEIRGLSPDRLIMSILKIPSVVFEEYQLSEAVSVVVDKEELLNAIKRLGRRDRVSLIYEDGARDLRIVLLNTKTGAERIFTARLLEAGSEAVGDIDLELDVEAQISGEVFSELVKDVAVVSDEMELRLSGDNMKIVARGENSEYSTTLAPDKGLLSLNSRLESASSKYSIDLVKQVARSIGGDLVVTLRYGPGKPMQVQTTLGGGASLTYWVYPRI